MVCVCMWYRTAKFLSFILNNKGENIKKYELNVLIQKQILIESAKQKQKENP